jgi:hypothetical protein
MRRHYVWYLLAGLWGAEAVFGFMRHSTASAAAAGVAAFCFVVAGLVLGRRPPRGTRRSR